MSRVRCVRHSLACMFMGMDTTMGLETSMFLGSSIHLAAPPPHPTLDMNCLGHWAPRPNAWKVPAMFACSLLTSQRQVCFS